MSYSLGIDVGSVNARLALIDDDCKIARLDTEKIISNPRDAVAALFSRLGEEFELKDIVSAAVSGSGKDVIPGELNWSEYSGSLSIASGLLFFHPEAKTIIQIGGQSSFVIGLEDGLRKPWKVVSNPLCAAGHQCPAQPRTSSHINGDQHCRHHGPRNTALRSFQCRRRGYD